MAQLKDFDEYMRKEADKYTKEIEKNRGGATSARQTGQRKRRLRERLYKLASIATGNLVFTTTDDSLKDAAISAILEEANISGSMGEEIEKYGVPPGGELVDDSNYEEFVEEDEFIDNPVLKPKTAKIFGEKDGFGDWFVNSYLSSRPMLRDMILKHYWYTKGGIKFGGNKSLLARTKSLKYMSWKLRTRISQNGIRPNSMIISGQNTILNYDSGSHTLDKGRDN
jgi:hypothetical protein